MSESEGRRRLQPRMARGSWHLSFWSALGQAVAFSLLVLLKTDPGNGWDAAGFWLFTTCTLLSATYCVYLLRVRVHDEPFWTEEEARRAEWDRRGRRL
jgi:hypothetical protein